MDVWITRIWIKEAREWEEWGFWQENFQNIPLKMKNVNIDTLTLPLCKANFGENVPKWTNQLTLPTSTVANAQTGSEAQHDFFFHKIFYKFYNYKA